MVFICDLISVFLNGITPSIHEHLNLLFKCRSCFFTNAYHLLRHWHNLDPRPYPGQPLAYIRNHPNLAYV